MRVFKLFDPNVSFFSLKIVQLTFFVNITLVILSLSSIAYLGKYEPNFSAAGYKFFLKEFTFPIGVLSTLIPIIAVFAVQHRSNQTIAQILESSRKNNFDISVRHYELFEIHLNKEGFSQYLEKYFVNLKRFHSSLFSEIYEGNIEITNEVSTELEYNLKKINTSIRNFQNIENNQSSLKAEQELGSIREYTDALGKLFNLNNLPRFNSNDRTTDEVKYVVTIDKYVKELVKLFKFINTSCNFSHNYKTAPLLYDGLTELVLLPVGNGSLSFGLHGYSNETLKREKLNLGIMLRRVAENK